MNPPPVLVGARPGSSSPGWIRLVGPLLLFCLRGLSWTWRGQIRGSLPPGGHILCLWHGDLLPWILPLSGRGRAVMVSLSRDGELLTEVLKKIGFRVVRGSSSRRGREALAELEAELRQGGDVILAVDGPRGPAGVAHSGAARLAAMTGAPVVSLGLSVSACWRLRTWDRLKIPLPFSRVTWQVSISNHTRGGGVPDLTREITASLDQARRHAEPPQGVSHNIWERLLFLAADLLTLGGVAVLSPLALLSCLHPRVRGELRRRLQLPRHLPQGLVWIHAASLGEVLLATRLVQHLGIQAVLTSSRVLPAGGPWDSTFCRVLVLPLDVPWILRAFIRELRPRGVWIMEGEVWPGLLRELRRWGGPVSWLNARLSARSCRRLSLLRPVLEPCLRHLDVLSPYTQQDLEYFSRLGARARHHMPPLDLKVLPDLTPPTPPADVVAALGGCCPWIAVSTHRGEEALLLDAHLVLRSSHPSRCLILAPRDPSRWAELGVLLEERGLSWCRLTELKGGVDVVVVDRLGVLVSLLPLAQVAFLGGSLVPVGGHNPWELAWAELPFVTGPYIHEIESSLQHMPTHWRGIATDVGGLVTHLYGGWLAPRPARPPLPPGLSFLLSLLRNQVAEVSHVG